MKQIELSLVVTAHNETVVCGPSMKSAEIAVAKAEAAGISVERIIALDSATEACKHYFHQPAFDGWTRLEFSERDLGRTRNAVLEKCAGKYIGFLDADDLFSENWLSDGVRLLQQAEAEGRRVIVHPEINWLFDGGASIFTKPDQSDPLFTPYYFQFANYYDSLFLAPRQAHEEISFIHRDIPNGLSFQDWQFSIESMAAGWEHVHARDTAIFKRRRDSSLVTESSSRRSLIRQLPAMAIDQIGKLGNVASGNVDHRATGSTSKTNG